MERKQNATVLTAENLATSGLKSGQITDFTGKSDFIKLEKGKQYHLGDVVTIPYTIGENKGVFAAFEILSAKKEFLGYVSLNTIQARKFVDVRLSNEGKPYCKYEVQNKFNAPEGTTFGVSSLMKLSGAKVKCVDIVSHKDVIFDSFKAIKSTDLSDFDSLDMVEKPLTLISLV